MTGMLRYADRAHRQRVRCILPVPFERQGLPYPLLLNHVISPHRYVAPQRSGALPLLGWVDPTGKSSKFLPPAKPIRWTETSRPQVGDFAVAGTSELRGDADDEKHGRCVARG